MNYEHNEDFSCILEGTDLNKILDASPKDTPELLGVIRSLRTEPCNAEWLAPMEGRN